LLTRGTLANKLAGTDTTLSSVKTLFLAMVNYPEVQRKAQEELDRVLQGRLPQLGDEADLPYTTAVVKEVLRWHPVTPLGTLTLVILTWSFSRSLDARYTTFGN